MSSGAEPSGSPAESATTTTTRRRGGACKRCRTQKIRCDGQQPVCSNCAKAKAVCARGEPDSSEAKQYVRELQRRITELENQVQSQALQQIQQNQHAKLVPAPRCLRAPAASPSHLRQASNSSSPVSPGSNIGPAQPLAHDVGLLSLGNPGEPKYLGPSSGVTFARLVYAAVPQTQGLPSSLGPQGTQEKAPDTAPQHRSGTRTPAIPASTELPPHYEAQYFINAYLDAWHTFYPFLDTDDFQDLVMRVYDREERSKAASTQMQPTQATPVMSMDRSQLFLVLALGAKVLESRLGTRFNSSQLYTTATREIGNTPLHDSFLGIQTLLLLVLCSLSFTDGLNAWFLSSTIVSSCLDLGLQRAQPRSLSDVVSQEERINSLRLENLRSGIFWSAYSIERTLAVVLGRPLTLRDEAIDNRMPGEQQNEEVDRGAIDGVTNFASETEVTDGRAGKRRRLTSTSTFPNAGDVTHPYGLAIYSFRFDRIVAEIKLMVYRVAKSPSRFPWPSDLDSWRKQAHEACQTVHTESKRDLRRQIGRHANHTAHSLSLKYHQCLILLYRPSPAFPKPSAEALSTCFNSAIETLGIHAEMSRFATLTFTWLTAHAVFVSGITMLYCLWTSQQLRNDTPVKDLIRYADACTTVLEKLGRTWSVAGNARTKFERLFQITLSENWKDVQLSAAGGNTNLGGSEAWDLSSMLAYGAPGGAQTLPVSADFSADMLENPIGGESMALPSTIMDELGDMGSWFDLDWLGDATYPAVPYGPSAF